jgi:hypothetical protein
MLILAPEQIENLAASLRGELLTTKDDAYEDARQAWPGLEWHD